MTANHFNIETPFGRIRIILKLDAHRRQRDLIDFGVALILRCDPVQVGLDERHFTFTWPYDLNAMMITETNESVTSGYCRLCGKPHSLKQGNARKYCLELIETLEKEGRIDVHVPKWKADPRLSLHYLRGEARGQMFGVLECLDSDGQPVILKAYSGQYNGVWSVEGWVPPLFDPEEFRAVVGDVDPQIKALGIRINELPEGAKRQELIHRRKKLSQDLMKEIHALYRVRNFRYEVKSLFDFFPNGIPAGAGDCCAPKLLSAAAKQKLVPKSLAEIFWGRSNRSGTRRQGIFYTACSEKCRPILGFMLCGAEYGRHPKWSCS